MLACVRAIGGNRARRPEASAWDLVPAREAMSDQRRHRGPIPPHGQHPARAPGQPDELPGTLASRTPSRLVARAGPTVPSGVLHRVTGSPGAVAGAHPAGSELMSADDGRPSPPARRGFGSRPGTVPCVAHEGAGRTRCPSRAPGGSGVRAATGVGAPAPGSRGRSRRGGSGDAVGTVAAPTPRSRQIGRRAHVRTSWATPR